MSRSPGYLCSSRDEQQFNGQTPCGHFTTAKVSRRVWKSARSLRNQRTDVRACAPVPSAQDVKVNLNHGVRGSLGLAGAATIKYHDERHRGPVRTLTTSVCTCTSSGPNEDRSTAGWRLAAGRKPRIRGRTRGAQHMDTLRSCLICTTLHWPSSFVTRRPPAPQTGRRSSLSLT